MKTTRPQKKKPEEIKRKPLRELEMAVEDWEEFDRGVNLFNRRQFWHAHEAWEQVWLRHDEDERLFFQGLIQLAAAYHHLLVKKSFQGMMNNFDKAYTKLEVFQPAYLGVRVTPLLRFIEQAKKEAANIGSDGIEQFNHNLIPKLQFHKPVNPDTMVEIRGVVVSEKFREGIKLFNKGYHWEAHEAWEDVWREEQGDGKTFAQAFVQMAAGYSFIKLSKLDSVKYLFNKAIEKFHQYENLDSGLSLGPLIEGMQHNLLYLESHSQNGNTGLKFLKIPPVEIPESK
jgi:predicted metal-dependent hydrolase